MSWWSGLTRVQRMVRRSAAYGDVFGARHETRTRSQHDVLADLAEFCRAVKPPIADNGAGAVDTNKSMILIGRQEVYFRICEIAGITPAQVRAYFEAAERPNRAANEGEET